MQHAAYRQATLMHGPVDTLARHKALWAPGLRSLGTLFATVGEQRLQEDSEGPVSDVTIHAV